jgi:hypothetical protein
VLFPLIGVRLHGWLDDFLVLLYALGIYFLGLRGAALSIGVFGAAVHFALARSTRYPQGRWGLVSFRTHAFIELAEGTLVLGAALLFVPSSEALARAFLMAMGASQFGAFALSDYQWPPAPSPSMTTSM